jgi:hypothetical protein
MEGERLTESNLFEDFRDYYVAPRYVANSTAENRKNCTGGRNIAVYQNNYLTYLTKSRKLIMYNLSLLYENKFKAVDKPNKDCIIEYDLGKVRPQAFAIENKRIKKDRIIVLLENGMIMKFYLGEKVPHRRITLPDSLRKGTLPTEIIHADSTTIVAVNELSSFSNVFICLGKKLEVAHRLTVPNQGSKPSLSLTRPPAQAHLPAKEEDRPRHQLLRDCHYLGKERPSALTPGNLLLIDSK